MPELPEVEAVCRRLRETVGHATIASARILRPSVTRPQRPQTVERGCANARIESIGRRGKHILIALENGFTLHVHLRMTGNLYMIPGVHFRAATVRAYFELAGGRALVFDDSRALGKIHLRKTSLIDELLQSVGPEPSELTTEEFVAAAKNARKPAKTFLMDQKQVSGLGNIYAAEALFRSKIHPAKPVNSISSQRLAKLHSVSREILAEAMDSSYAAYAEPGRFDEGESFLLAVYDREGRPCTVCGTKIRRIPQGGRSTYFCPKCQRG